MMTAPAIQSHLPNLCGAVPLLSTHRVDVRARSSKPSMLYVWRWPFPDLRLPLKLNGIDSPSETR